MPSGGGTGADVLHGGTGEEILIGGYTWWDTYETGLLRLRDGWSAPTLGYSQRVHNHRTGYSYPIPLDSSHVYDDWAADSLYGDADPDWFWSFAGDTTDLTPG